MTVTVFKRKERPTNADLQDSIAEAHDCIHKVGQDVTALAEVVKEAGERHAAVDLRLARLEGSTDALVKYFGVRPDVAKQPVRLGALAWWQAVLGIACSVIGSLAGWKYVLVPVAAGVVAAAHAFLHVN